MTNRGIITTCLFSLLLAASPAWAGRPVEVDASAYNKQAPQAPRGSATRLEKADDLIKALTRRSLVLAQRTPAARPRAASSPAARSARPRLASRAGASMTQRHAASPAAPACNLVDYLGILDRVTPGGQITGRFSDWRSPSVYRAFGGRHNGYDVALGPGSLIVVGWPGRVSAITHWYGAEYGITVLSPDGFQTIYGHLAPCVRIGQWLEPGDAVGTIVRDHVDIKMKDGGGKPIDFARGVPLLNRTADHPQATALVAGDSSVFPPLAGPDWTLRQEAVKAALEYARLRYQEASLLVAGAAAPAPMIAQVRADLVAARNRLAVEEVPEEVLLAAFLDSPAVQAGTSAADAGEGGANALADWLRRQQTLRDARQSTSQLDQLLVDLRG